MSSRKQSEPARYYIVQHKIVPGIGVLVEANKPTQALTYYAQEHFTARLATTREAVNMMDDGAPVVRWNKKPEQLDIEDTLPPPEPPLGGKTPAQVMIENMKHNTLLKSLIENDTGASPTESALTLTGLPAHLEQPAIPCQPAADAGSPTTTAGVTSSPKSESNSTSRAAPQRRRLMASEVFGKGFTHEE